MGRKKIEDNSGRALGSRFAACPVVWVYNVLVMIHRILDEQKGRWQVPRTKSKYQSSCGTKQFWTHLQQCYRLWDVLVIGVRLVKIGGRSGYQNLLENGRMLARTNIYLWKAQLFYPNAWPPISSSIYKQIPGILPQTHPIQIHLSAILWNQADTQNILFRHSAYRGEA